MTSFLRSDFKLPPLEEIDFQPIERAEEIATGWNDGPPVEHGYSHACYIPAKDEIQMPRPAVFATPEEYYQTRFHERGHATGHKGRLNRDMTGHFGSNASGKEELIAEMTALFSAPIAESITP